MAPPPVLVEDTSNEILLRVPPDEPAHLIRASAVCKLWRRILSDPTFGRRYREFHRVPPMLGFFSDDTPQNTPRFVPTTLAPTLFKPPPFDYNCMLTLDSRHGRVLCREPSSQGCLLVWDPITGDCQRLPWNQTADLQQSSSMVLCAAVGGGCNHHDCHRGDFLVVSVGFCFHRNPYGGVIKIWACMYTSKTGSWGEPISLDTGIDIFATNTETGVHIGDELYFSTGESENIVKFSLDKNHVSMIDVPSMHRWFDVLIVNEDRSLGFAGVRGSSLYLWSRKVEPEGLARWVEYRVIRIDNPWRTTIAVGFADGIGVVLLSTEAGTFALDLRSGLKKRISEHVTECSIFPFMSFYTPGRSSRPFASTLSTEAGAFALDRIHHLPVHCLDVIVQCRSSL